MRTLTKLSALAILATSAIACGGDGGEVEQRECGAGTVLVDGQCEVDESNCGEGSVLNADGQCEPTDEICGENTAYDAGLGRCVPTRGIQCAEGTVEEGGECVPADAVECDDGTVVANNQCVPAEDVCGEGTEFDSQDRCRPSDQVCGEGTTFDVATRTCVPTSQLSCGAGTITIDGVCRLRSAVVADLAATATLDLDTSDGEPVVLLANDPVVFTGNIDAPAMVEGEYVQDLDTLVINGTAGQWVRVAIHADGMPEPGFVFMEEVAEPVEPIDPEDPDAEEPPAPFSRTSDAGVGLDFSRHIVIPADGVYALNVGPIAQLLELAGPAGGEDWGYVGSIELVDAPTPTAVEFPQDAISGDVRNLTENFYEVSGVTQGDQFVFFLDQIPSDSQAEVQVWTDATTLVDTLPIDGGVFTMDAPAESFFLLVDRVFADGPATLYDAQPNSSQSLDAEAVISETITLNAGESITISQWNEAEADLSARINVGEEAVAESSALRPRTDDSGTRSLEWFVFEETEVTVEFENTSEDALEGVVTGITVNAAVDAGEVTDGASVALDRSFQPGQTAYVTFEITEVINWAISLSGEATASFEILDPSYTSVVSGTDGSTLRAGELEPGAYVLILTASSTIAETTRVSFAKSTFFQAGETDISLNLPPDFGIFESTESSITVPESCALVGSIELYFSTTSGTYQDDLRVTLIDPRGDEYRLLNVASSTNSTALDVTFPTTREPVESLSPLVGSEAPGTWTLLIEYEWTNASAGVPEWYLLIDCAE